MNTSLRLRSALLLVFLPLTSAYPLWADVIYVDANAAGANNGTSWTDAFKYLQNALAAAGSATEICVAQGTYRPDMDTAHPGGTNDRTATFQLKNGVALYGGFPVGGGIRDPSIYKTIFSGDINVSADNSDNSYHVVTGTNTDSSAILDGFTITAGYANGFSSNNFGGGMYNNSGSPIVTTCAFTGNFAVERGGGMCNLQSNPTVTNCIFSGNSSDNIGGGMYNNIFSSPTITNCTFSDNSAVLGGGGMYNRSNPTMTNCTFSGNSAYSGGGVYSNYYQSPKLTNCILWGNTASLGPQIYDGSYPGAPTVSFSDIQGGWAGTGNINANPLFVDANGPDNIPGTEDDNLRLSPGSPCIDTASNTAVPAVLTTDLDGKDRFVDGDCNGMATVDMGAFEFAPADIGDFDSDCYVDLYDYAVIAASWLQNDPLSDIAPTPAGDGMVDAADLAVLAEHWLEEIQYYEISEPVYEYPIDNVVTNRNSQIIDATHTTIPVNTARTQTITSIGASVPIISSRITVAQAIDHVSYGSDAILCVNGSMLEYTTDLINYTTICNFSSICAVGDVNTIYSYGAAYHRGYAYGSNWYLSVGDSDGEYDPDNYSGILIKSADKGQTWTEILKTKNGILYFDIKEDMLLVGEYHSYINDVTTSGRNLFLSTDAGETFKKIYDYGPIQDNGNPNHFHGGLILDANTVYVGYGDGLNEKTWKLTRPSPDWVEGTNWHKTPLTRHGYTPARWAHKDGKVYLTREIGSLGAIEAILAMDTSTDEVSSVFYIPRAVDSPTYAPYISGMDYGTFGILNDNGVLYATLLNYTSTCPKAGLIASADGVNWTTLFRDPSIYGVKYLVGTATINGIRYVIGRYCNAYNNAQVIAFPVGNVKSKTAVCVQKGFTNHLARMNVDYLNDQWQYFSSSLYDGVGTQDTGLVGHGMKYTAYDNSCSIPGLFKGDIKFSDDYKWAGNYPSTGDYISFSFYFKQSQRFIGLVDDAVGGSYWSVSATNALFNNTNNRNLLAYSSNWLPYSWFNKCNDAGNRTSYISLTVRSQNEYSQPFYRDGITTIFDRLTLAYSADRWIENPAPLMADCTGETLIPGVVADEYVVLPAAVEGKAWTLAFDWYPMSGYKSYPYAADYPTLPIATIIGTGGSYIDLDWDRHNAKFKLTDIDSDATLTPPVAAIDWQQADCVKIAIVCDGTDSVLYMWMPESFAVNSDYDGIIDTGDDADSIGLANIPIAFRLGTDHSESNIGAGCYTNIRIFDSALSSSDVAVVFNNVDSMK